MKVIGVVLVVGAVLVPASTSGARALGRHHGAVAATEVHRSGRAAPTRSRIRTRSGFTFGARGVPAPVTGTATVTADPSSGLLDGQVLAVTGGGLAPKTEYALVECVAGSTDLSGCSIFDLTVVKTDTGGSFSGSFTAARLINPDGSGVIGVGVGVSSSDPVDCAVSACVLAVAAEDQSLPAVTPIAFADVAIVPPTLAVDPSTGLLDGQKVTVSGTGFGAGTPVLLTECVEPDVTVDCDFATVALAVAADDGSLSSSYEVTRVINGGENPVDCAQPSTCVVTATSELDPTATVSAPISFADVAIVPPTMTVTPSTGLIDGQNVTVTGKGFRPHDEILLTECAAGSLDGSECVAEAGLGNGAELTATKAGKISATFNVAEVLTLDEGTVNCLQAPGCVLGAVDAESETGAVAAAAPLGFAAGSTQLPPLNLALHIDPTDQIVAAAAGKGNAADIKGTITCDRSSATPVSFQMQVTEPVGSTQAGGDVEGVAACSRTGTAFTISVSSGHSRRAPGFVPGPAGVLLELFADSGSSAQQIEGNDSITLKVAKT
jgi:hypothetical protein